MLFLQNDWEGQESDESLNDLAEIHTDIEYYLFSKMLLTDSTWLFVIILTILAYNLLEVTDQRIYILVQPLLFSFYLEFYLFVMIDWWYQWSYWLCALIANFINYVDISSCLEVDLS